MKFSFPIGAGWLPDLPPTDILKAGGLVVAKNILPVAGGYAPVFDKATYNASAASGTALNGVYVQDVDSLYYNFLGTTTKLYRFTASLMTDISKLATTYTGTSWNFSEYNKWLVATNFAENPQVLKGLTVANCVDLGGSPPKAKFCLTNNTHLILGNINDGTAKPKDVRWSARGNCEDWTPSALTGAGFQELTDMLGVITGIGALGDSFAITSENSVSVGYYVGGADTYSFKINAIRGTGCYFSQSFISIGTDTFFWGKDSIYRYNGVDIEDIGVLIKKTVMPNISMTYSHRISVAHDRINGLIIWLYPTLASAGAPDRMLVYNYIEKRWSIIGMSGDALFVAVSGGILADGLALTLIDSLGVLIDSSYWLANAIQPMIVDNADSKVKTFSGPMLEMEIETGEISDLPKMLNAQKIYPSLIGVGAAGGYVVKYRASDEAYQSSSLTYTTTADKTTMVSAVGKKLALNLKSSNFIKVARQIDTDIVERGGR